MSEEAKAAHLKEIAETKAKIVNLIKNYQISFT